MSNTQASLSRPSTAVRIAALAYEKALDGDSEDEELAAGAELVAKGVELADQHDAALAIIDECSVALHDVHETILPEFLRDHPGSYRAIGRLRDAYAKAQAYQTGQVGGAVAALHVVKEQIGADLVLVEQMEVWANELEAGRTPVESIVAGLREVAADVKRQREAALEQAKVY